MDVRLKTQEEKMVSIEKIIKGTYQPIRVMKRIKKPK